MVGKSFINSIDRQIFVLSVPISDKNFIKDPDIQNHPNLDKIITNIQKLKCDMYDDSIILFSLANHPSKSLLEKFTSSSLSKIQ